MALRFISRDYLDDRWGAARVAALAAAGVAPDGDEDDADAAVDGAMATAESQAISYLLARYPDDVLPTTPETTPNVLAQNVADLAIYDLARSHDLLGDDLVRAQANALSWLNKIAASRADLGLASAPSVDSSRPQIAISKTKQQMVFTDPIRGIGRW